MIASRDLTVTMDHPFSRDSVFMEWLSEQGVVLDDTFEVRICGDRMTVFQYDRNAEGRKYVDRETGGAAQRAAFVVRCSSPWRSGTCCTGRRKYATAREVAKGRLGWIYPCRRCGTWHHASWRRIARRT